MSSGHLVAQGVRLSPTDRYSYDITNSLQTNLTVLASNRAWNTRFMWNHHLLSPVFDLEEPKGRSRWVLPLIHGFVDQASEFRYVLAVAPSPDRFLCRNPRLLTYRLPHPHCQTITTLCRSAIPDERRQRGCEPTASCVFPKLNAPGTCCQ